MAALHTAGPVSPATRYLGIGDALALESGARIAEPGIAYRTWGRLNEDGDNAVLICHALTGSADADDWWPGIIGAGRALDPDEDFIVCSNVLGGCYGSSGPLTPAADGAPHGLRFPRITIRDIVRAQRLLLARLGVRRLRLVIGPSLGGMQTLEWGAMHADIVDAIAPIGVSARHSAWCIGIGHAQRQAISADPDWRGGRYPLDRPPASGLGAARMMAMVTYRSWDNFERRFSRAAGQVDAFDVESYLDHQGRKLVGRFDAASYFRLTQAMDSHDLGRDRGGDFERVLLGMPMPALVVSVSSDVLYPPAEQETLARHLPAARYRQLDSPHGHDGFLIDLEALSGMIMAFRAEVAAGSTEERRDRRVS